MINLNASYNPYCLATKFSKTVKDYKETTLRGLGAMCDDAKAQRIADFKAAHKPVDGTPEEMRAFYEKLAQYMQSLERIADRERSESLISFGELTEDDEVTPPLIQMYAKMMMVE